MLTKAKFVKVSPCQTFPLYGTPFGAAEVHPSESKVVEDLKREKELSIKDFKAEWNLESTNPWTNDKITKT